MNTNRSSNETPKFAVGQLDLKVSHSVKNTKISLKNVKQKQRLSYLCKGGDQQYAI